MSFRYKIVNKINEVLLKRNLVLTASLYQQPRGSNMDLSERSFDFIRAACMKLRTQEIAERNHVGAIAELGVYKGGTAAMLSKWLPNHKLYLLDTFEGFDKRDLDVDFKEGFSSGKQEFEDTSVETVRSQLPNPQNAVFVVGFFPETAGQIPEYEKFSLVSIDVDLYAPILAGLRYFWPRMSSGGTIFVHDYGTTKFQGSKKAVREFSDESGAQYVALPDTAGSALFIKP